MSFKDLLKKLPMRSLRVDIMTAFLVLLIASSVTIISYTYKKNSQLIVKFARDTMDSVSNTAIFQLKNFVSGAESVVQTGSSILNDPTKATLKETDLIDFMFSVISYNPQIENYYFGMGDGTFLEVSRKKRDKGKTTVFRVRYIKQDGHKGLETALYIDPEGKLLYKEVNPHAQYDPRKRPWFIKTPDRKLSPSTIFEIEPQHKFVSWTDVYEFESQTHTGISVSDSIHDYNGKWIGVVGADVTLEGLSSFLSTQVIGKTGSEIIVGKDGDVIASPQHHDERLKYGVHDKLTVDRLDNPVYETAFNIYKNTKDTSFRFYQGDTEYLATLTPFIYQSFPKKWLILIVVPIKDFLGDIIKTHRDNLFISATIVLFSILAIVLLSREISRPLMILARQINEIKEFHLDNPIDTTSTIREIHLISSATKRMQEAVKAFSFYVPKELVQKLITQGASLEMGGTTKELTILFTDIVGFTAISEEMPPDDLMKQLSEYLDTISQVILTYNGTIDKYIGDNVMAFWNAPEEDAEHPFHACEAALRIQKTIEKLNNQWKTENKPLFLTKIGLHRDHVIVGNIGTHERRNYTVIGDGVNLTSRLEQVNQTYGTQVLISEELNQSIYEKFLTRPVDIIAVKGKKKCIKIFELIGMYDHEDLSPSKKQIDEAQLFREGFDQYIHQKWDDALSTFEKCDPNDSLVQIYLTRCRKLRDRPPESWDPVTQIN
jgi:adenylate cyclase